jgi:hypothetical protein
MKVRLISEPRSDSFQLDLPSFSDARVVELVDTRGSGPRARKGLQVQVLSRVPLPTILEPTPWVEAKGSRVADSD